MWAVESNGEVSAVEERQRVGFYVPTPPSGQEPMLVSLLTHSLSANASTGGGARFVCMEPGGEFAVRHALDAVEAQEEEALAAHQDSGFAALVAQSEESKQRQEWLNPFVPVSKRLFYTLRLSEEVHRFPDACVDQVRTALTALQIDALDLVLVPWPSDPAPLSRHVRQRQVSLFMKLWNGPLTSLLVDGRVKAMGGDGLENWQLERLIDDAHEAPMFNALALTPQRGRYNEVRFCQSRGIEVLALLGHPVPSVLTETGALSGVAAEDAQKEEEENKQGNDNNNSSGSGELSKDQPPRSRTSTPMSRSRRGKSPGNRNNGKGSGASRQGPRNVPEIALHLGRTDLKVEITWALQRGLIVVPPTLFPDANVMKDAEQLDAWKRHATSRASDCFSLVHPFTRRPLFCSPTLVHRVSLEPAHMAAIAALDEDYRAEQAAIHRALEASDAYYHQATLPTAAQHAAWNRERAEATSGVNTGPDGILPTRPDGITTTTSTSRQDRFAGLAADSIPPQGTSPANHLVIPELPHGGGGHGGGGGGSSISSGGEDLWGGAGSPGGGPSKSGGVTFSDGGGVQGGGGGGSGGDEAGIAGDAAAGGNTVGSNSSGLLLAPLGDIAAGEGGVLVDPTDEEAFLRFAENSEVNPETKLKAMLGAFFGAETEAQAKQRDESKR